MYLSLLREERTPSFSVSYDKNLWHDFGTGEGGSIIALGTTLHTGHKVDD